MDKARFLARFSLMFTTIMVVIGSAAIIFIWPYEHYNGIAPKLLDGFFGYYPLIAMFAAYTAVPYLATFISLWIDKDVV